jgi:hypothetical protein
MAKYIAADGTGSPFDLASNFAVVLKKTGLIKDYQPPKPVLKPATFGVGSYTDGKPFIVANCNTCHMKWRYEGANPQAMEACHCKMKEHPPAGVISEYLEAYRSRTWKDKTAPERKFETRPAPQTVSSF